MAVTPATSAGSFSALFAPADVDRSFIWADGDGMTPEDRARVDAASSEAGFEDLLVGRGEKVVALARAVRALIRDLDPNVVEVPWLKQGVVGFGIGPRKFTEHYAYLALHGDHVNLGFNQGAELDDPAGLLSGPGKSLRHCRLDNLDDLRRPGLVELLSAAQQHRRATTHSSGGPARKAPEARSRNEISSTRPAG